MASAEWTAGCTACTSPSRTFTEIWPITCRIDFWVGYRFSSLSRIGWRSETRRPSRGFTRKSTSASTMGALFRCAYSAIRRSVEKSWPVYTTKPRSASRSIRLDPAALDHRSPPLDLRLHEGAEFLRGPGHHVEADLRHALADFGRAQRAHGGVVQLRHDLARSFRRRRNRLPGRDHQVRVSRLRGGRHIGQLRVTRFRRHRERLHPAGFDVVGHRAQVLEREIDLIAHDVGLARGAALVRYVDRGEIRALAKHFAGEVVRRAAAARAVGEAPRVLLRKLDQLLP